MFIDSTTASAHEGLQCRVAASFHWDGCSPSTSCEVERSPARATTAPARQGASHHAHGLTDLQASPAAQWLPVVFCPMMQEG